MNNQKYCIVLLLVLFCISCGRNPDIGWANDFDDYVNSYVNLAQQNHNPARQDRLNVLGIKFVPVGSLGGNVIGLCQTTWNGNIISIDRGEWDGAQELGKQALIFHELGHCVHGMEHRGIEDSTGRETSIMYPYLIWWGYYQANYDDYNTELFTGYFAPDHLNNGFATFMEMSPSKEYKLSKDGCKTGE